MFKVHHDAQYLPTHDDFTPIEHETHPIPHLHASASQKDGVTHVSIANLHPSENAQLQLSLRGVDLKNARARILTSDALDAHNTFDAPNTIEPSDFAIGALKNGQVTIDVPSKSVIVIAFS